MGRTDTASLVIKASPKRIYDAHVDAQSLARWRAPPDMRAEVHGFDPRVGGGYRMTLVYTGPEHELPGKTSKHEDAFDGQFVELVPYERIVERVTFRSADPAFAGAMTITTTLTPVAGGTKIEIVCRDVPTGIRESDHQKGLVLALENLAAFTE